MKALLLSTLFLTGLLRAGEYLQVNLPLGPRGSVSSFHYFVFSTKDHTLRVIDQGSGARRYKNLESAMRANGCVAGMSGVDFGRNGKPPGLLIAAGLVRGRADPKAAEAAATLYAEKGQIRLVRSSVFNAKAPPLPREVIQTGPYLIEGGKLASDLDGGSFTRRSVIATDGKGKWLIAYTPPTSQVQLATVLSLPSSLENFNIVSAVEVAQGSLAAMWCRLPHAPLYFREIDPLPSFIGIAEK